MRNLPLAVVAACAAGLTLPLSAAGQSAADSLEQADTLFDGLPAWFGSMYDRQSGGAYWSLSARQNPQRYPPHIESTQKYAGTVARLGRVAAAPGGVRDGVVAYVKSRQVGDSGHRYYGFFLDPAYTSLDPANDGATVDSRAAGRALDFAQSMLGNFGATPDHPLPTGDRVSGAQPQLASAQAFRDYIDSRDWSNVWAAGSDIRHQVSFIRQLDTAKADEIVTAAVEHLEANYRDPATGYWRKPGVATNTSAFIRLNGAMKLAGFYTDLGQAVPLADALAETALAEVETKTPSNLLHVFNASELVKDIGPSMQAPLSPAEVDAFTTRLVQQLGRFRQRDGGFATHLSGTHSSELFPATAAPYSDADASGLAFVTRNNLHEIVSGAAAPPLQAANDPRLFALSGEVSDELVAYTFANASPEARTLGPITASTFASSGAATPGDAPGGYVAGGGGADDYAIIRSGFDDSSSYYEFTVDFHDAPVDLYFLALSMRHSGSASTLEEVRVLFSVDGGAFAQAGRTEVGGGTMRLYDVPLVTLAELQGVTGSVTFRIQGWNFALPGRTLRLDDVTLHGVVPEPSVLTILAAGAAALSLPRRR